MRASPPRSEQHPHDLHAEVPCQTRAYPKCKEHPEEPFFHPPEMFLDCFEARSSLRSHLVVGLVTLLPATEGINNPTTTAQHYYRANNYDST